METPTVISLQEFTALYAEYSRRFTDIAFSYLQDRQEAEDVVSESFMAFWNGREDGPLAQNLPSYILGIVKHKCLDALRSRESTDRRCRNIFQQACRDAQIRVLENDELTQKLFEDEIAEAMDLPVRTVTREIQKGLVRLRKSMKDYLPLALLLLSIRA